MSSIFGQDVLDIVSDIVDPATSILHLTFILPCALCSNSSIFGQDVLDIVSDIVDPAASMLLAIPVFSGRMSWTLYPTS